MQVPNLDVCKGQKVSLIKEGYERHVGLHTERIRDIHGSFEKKLSLEGQAEQTLPVSVLRSTTL